MFNAEQIKALGGKLDPANIKPAKSFGPKGDYIEGWHAMAEANRIFGFDGWSYTITECTCVAQNPRPIGQNAKPGFGVTYTAKVSVIAGEVTREDFGAGHGYDVDLGLAHESAIKEAVTDALKRALRSFGNVFGLALYDKTRANVGFDEPQEPAPDIPKIYDAIILDMKRCDTPDDLERWKKDPQALALVNKLPDDWFAKFKPAMVAHKQALIAKANGDAHQLGGD